MRFIAWVIFIAIASVGAAWVTANNQGHVTLYWSAHRIDLSMNLFLLMTFAAFLITFFVLKLFSGIVDLPFRAASYRQSQREARAIRAVADSVNHLFAGRYAKALKSAELGVGFPSVADVSLLIAASASHRLRQFPERDAWLEKISEDDYQQSKLVMMAEMQLDARDAKGALETIDKLQQKGARQFLVQHIALRAHQMLENWEEVIRLTQLLAKRNILHPLIAKSRIQEAIANLAAHKGMTSEVLWKRWQSLTTEDRQSVNIVKAVAQGFLRLSDYVHAQQVLNQVLDLGPIPELLNLYPQCAESNGVAAVPVLSLIQKVEAWLLKYPAEPALHLALGRLCIRQQLWGKAKSSLSQVLGSPRANKQMEAQAHIALSTVHEALHEAENAAIHYKAAIQLLM